MIKDLWIKHINFKQILLYTLLFFFVFQACKKEPDTPNDFYQYLNGYEKISTLSQSFITTIYRYQSIQYPEITELLNNTQYDVDIYRINYNTTYQDSGIIASGIVCIPDAPEAFPILSFQNGTNTSHNNAPSVSIANSYFTLLQSLAGNGYILLIPDYIGFGSSEDILHPYYQKETNNDAIIDMIYAARELLDYYEGSAIYEETCFLMGYSQGGWATLSALKEIESNMDVDFTVKATSCGAGAYKLLNVANDILQRDTFPGPLYLPYYIYSHQQYGTIHDPLGKFFREPYSSDIPQLFNGNYTNSEVNNHLTNTIADLITADMINNLNVSEDFLELRTDLEHNSIDAWLVNSLLRFYHGNADNNVPINQSISIFNDFLLVGNNAEIVKYYEMDGLNHETGILPWGINSIIWFNQLKAEK